MKIRKIAEIGKGGQARVWSASVIETGEQVAMKIFEPDGTPEQIEEDRRRFLREVRCQSEMSHPNIMKVLAFNSTDDPPWYVMPWAEKSLRDLLNENSGGLPRDEALRIFGHILDGMMHAHSEGVLHRDLKPENVLIIEGDVRVSDFGLGRRIGSNSTTITAAAVGIGSVAYSAPEQFHDLHSAAHAADVFALGKILYELLTGRLPFPNLDYSLIDNRFGYIIRRCIDHAPDRRYPSIEELANELTLLADDSDELHAPVERASNLQELIAAGDGKAAVDLCKLLIEHADDMHLYARFVPYLTAKSIEALIAADESSFLVVLEHFDLSVDGSHPFSYTDVLANFMKRVYDHVDDGAAKERILSRLLVLGADHNRFHVGDVFLHVAVAMLQEPGGPLVLARVLKDNPDSVPFVSEGLRERGVPQVVAVALDEIEKSAAAGDQANRPDPWQF